MIFSVLGAVTVAGSSAGSVLAYHHFDNLKKVHTAIPAYPLTPARKFTPARPIMTTEYYWQTWGPKILAMFNQKYLKYAHEWYYSEVPGDGDWYHWRYDYYYGGEPPVIQAIMKKIIPTIKTTDYWFYNTLSHGDGWKTDLLKVLEDGVEVSIVPRKGSVYDHGEVTISIKESTWEK